MRRVLVWVLVRVGFFLSAYWMCLLSCPVLTPTSSSCHVLRLRLSQILLQILSHNL